MIKTLYILLILFIVNQFSTSIICLLQNDKEVNISIYDQEEEEEEISKENKEYKEFKSKFIGNKNFDLVFFAYNKSSKINAFYLISEYKVATTITILPPEQF